MKKIFFFILLSFISIGAYAQFGTPDIRNNTLCTMHITMYAIAPTTGDNCFDLISNAIILPPGNSIAYNDVNGFNVGTGWAVETVPVSDASADFTWSSVHFSFSGCPTSWGCTPAAGNMGDASIGCTGTGSSYSSTCHSVTGSWTSAGTPLSSVFVEFH